MAVNGSTAPAAGCLIEPGRDSVAVDGQEVRAHPGPHRYLMLNKPTGYLSSAASQGGLPTVMDLLGDPQGLRTVGRLDLDSSGLLLLTDDGDLAYRLTHPRYQVVKVYRVTVGAGLNPEQVAALAAGPVLSDGPTHPLAVRVIRRRPERTTMEVELAEGRQREVRRMCAAVGVRVVELERVRLGPLRLGTLPPGRVRELGQGELLRLRREVGLAT